MKTVQAHIMNLTGTNYEIGFSLGSLAASIPPLKVFHPSGFPRFTAEDTKNAIHLFSRFCPGLMEELTGFADALKVSPEQMVYYAMTYLRPSCSHIALLPQMTANGHTLIARTYEFNDDTEDFTLMKTSVTGKYTHIGTSVLSFGRDDGFNECGLSITQSSCGFPVGPMKEMRHPAVAGLQFWAVIRTLLENCKDVDEVLTLIREIPIAYNLNLIAADKSGTAALIETLDGKMAAKRIDESSREKYLHATNHPHLKELIPYEPQAMANSLTRYNYIKRYVEQLQNVSAEDLKKLLLGHFPDGLCCHYYKDYFGTTKSMIIDPVDGTIDLCWGGRIENGWHRYSMAEAFENTTQNIELSYESPVPELFEFKPLI